MIGIQNVQEIQRLRGTPLEPEWIQARLTGYADHDATTAELTRILQEHRALVIHTPDSGTGRYTTALHILRALKLPDIRQVRRQIDDAVELEGLKDTDTGWILDLRNEMSPMPAGFGHHLGEGKKHLEESRSFLVVVTSTALWAGVADEAHEIAHLLTPATGPEVVRARLCRHTPPINPDAWLSNSRITAHLKHATPAEAADWARRITEAVTLNPTASQPSLSDPDDTAFTELVDAVVESAENWRSELTTWHCANTDSGHRNYLLAAAVVDEGPVGVVHRAYTELSTALDDEPVPTKGQRGPGLIELTHRVGAELGTDDRVRFTKPGYTEAVVDYFWVDRPHHVQAFTRWTAAYATSLPKEPSARLANRVSQWIIRYTLAKQSLTVLRTTATQWAADGNLKDHAVDLLVAAAIDPVAGKLARDRYLHWAKAPDAPTPDEKTHTPPHLKRALAAAMAQLAPAYHGVALTRLGELAAHTESSDVSQAVGEALTTLWDQDKSEDTLRKTLTTWLTSTQPHRVQAATQAFLHLAQRTSPDGTPILLPQPTDTQPWILTGWRSALDNSTSQIQPVINTWLEAALNNPRLRATIIGLFTEAAFQAGTRIYLARRALDLDHAANGWEPACAGQPATPRTELRNELQSALMSVDPVRHAPTP
ncbi:hypothetical protein [Streptomyces hydrogenans]|uniref:hypothetical protein n=1 Tax=Streptomyces hydrogenans TaxID=1873719 RepID=UPI00369CCBCC